MQVQQREIDLMLERERVSLLTSFMQNTAHEFRTPLSSIATSTYLMSRSEDTERRAEKAGQIEMQVQRITRLLDMLLTMVRVESDGELIRRPVQIEAVFEAICQDVQAYYGKQPALFCEHTKALPIVRGDAEYLSEALRHILDNAYRFTPPDGAITVSCGTEAGAVWLMVEDTGPGIAEEDLPHIFETFWRQDSAHSTPGFGLGLPIARRIIQQHGGEIMVESKAGQGTRVRVHLPVSEVSERSTLVS